MPVHDCTICFGKISSLGNCFGGFGGSKAKCCNYWYHRRCLDQWYQEHNLCPTCRSIKKKVFQSRNASMELRESMFVWTDPIRKLAVRYKDISSIEMTRQNGNLAIEVHLSQNWAGYKFLIASHSRDNDIKKVYDSIVHLIDTSA